jgi:hypothetical protein
MISFLPFEKIMNMKYKTKEEMDLRIRQLLDKYYVDEEFTMMGIERKDATLELIDEIKIIAESHRRSEVYLEEQLEAHSKQIVSVCACVCLESFFRVCVCVRASTDCAKMRASSVTP